MKKYILEFIHRGLTACGFGPIVLAIIYLILKQQGVIESLSISQVSREIFSLSALAFVAGGMNVVYQVERLPLMVAIFIHGIILYSSYLVTYLLNDWMEGGVTPILVFTGVFLLSYLIIWVIIYSVIKRNTEKINRALKQKQLD